MTLVDAGPLIALLDRGEPAHARCVAALPQLRGPLVTSWPAFTEAMSLLGRAGGWTAQDALWRLVDRGDLDLARSDELDPARARALMERYQDVPMDLADASLVALAEAQSHRLIFTLDGHFRAYRLRSGRSLAVVP